jgi:hypothetical protein
MKFSEMLTEYLQLREDEATRDDSWTPIAQRGQRRDRMNELLEGMDQLIAASGVKGPEHG